MKKSPAWMAIRSWGEVEQVDHFGKVEQHPFRVWGGVQHGPQQVPSPPSDIGYDAESLEVVGIEDRCDISRRFAVMA